MSSNNDEQHWTLQQWIYMQTELLRAVCLPIDAWGLNIANFSNEALAIAELGARSVKTKHDRL